MNLIQGILVTNGEPKCILLVRECSHAVQVTILAFEVVCSISFHDQSKVSLAFENLLNALNVWSNLVILRIFNDTLIYLLMDWDSRILNENEGKSNRFMTISHASLTLTCNIVSVEPPWMTPIWNEESPNKASILGTKNCVPANSALMKPFKPMA